MSLFFLKTTCISLTFLLGPSQHAIYFFLFHGNQYYCWLFYYFNCLSTCISCNEVQCIGAARLCRWFHYNQDSTFTIPLVFYISALMTIHLTLSGVEAITCKSLWVMSSQRTQLDSVKEQNTTVLQVCIYFSLCTLPIFSFWVTKKKILNVSSVSYWRVVSSRQSNSITHH